MKIGITIGLTQENESLWINGIKLNALNLASTLMEIKGFDVWLLDTGHSVKDLTKVDWDHTKYRIATYKEVILDFDVLIMLGTTIPDENLIDLKKLNKKIKIVKYQCGNNYVVDMERVLFGDPNDDTIPSWDTNHDETWYVPQQGYQNHEYYKLIYKQSENQVKPVPFVWNPEHMLGFVKDLNIQNVYYKPKEDVEKNIVVMEPNMNVVKYSLIPVLIVEDLYRRIGKKFNNLIIISGKKLLKNLFYKRMIFLLDIFNINPAPIKYTGRYSTPYILGTQSDIILSHQWENPLNYAYLDALYYNYPLIHNADFIKDAGYYYKGFDISEGSIMLEEALSNHDKNIEDYNKRNSKVLNRYMSTNPNIVDTYKKLIENLFKPDKHKMSYKYNTKTNNYK